jgi:hypothetical protein
VADQDASFVISARDATKEAFQSAASSLQGLGERANEVKELMHQLAAAFAIHEIAHFIGQAIEARAKMEDLAQIAGTTPQELSKFEQPARLAGTSLDTVATAMARLTRSIGEARAGNTEKEAFLKALGVDPATADDSAAAMETVLRSMERRHRQEQCGGCLQSNSWPQLCGAAPARASSGSGQRVGCFRYGRGDSARQGSLRGVREPEVQD